MTIRTFKVIVFQMTATTEIQVGHSIHIIIATGGLTVKVFGTVISKAVGYSVKTASGGLITFSEGNIDEVMPPCYDGDCAAVYLKAV